MSQLVREIPDDLFFDLYRVIETVSLEEGIELDSRSYISLIDHIHFAFQRHESGQIIRNFMMSDLKILYAEEFRFARSILVKINHQFKFDLPDDEIGFLTMHIVNGVHSQIKNQSSLLTDMVFDCLNIIRDTYLISLKSEDLATQRMMIHIKMLIQRVLEDVQVDFDEIELHNVIVEFESAYSCTLKIRDYIEKRLSTQINSQELVYLTIHLNRLEQMLPLGL